MDNLITIQVTRVELVALCRAVSSASNCANPALGDKLLEYLLAANAGPLPFPRPEPVKRQPQPVNLLMVPA